MSLFQVLVIVLLSIGVVLYIVDNILIFIFLPKIIDTLNNEIQKIHIQINNFTSIFAPR